MYVKLFQAILYSSIWDEDSDTRVVWITLLVLADEDGFVRTTDNALAMMARVTHVTLCNALRVLEAPDPQSGSPDFEGRRIEKVDGGYMILNYIRHKETMTKAEQREQVRRRVAAYRGRQKESQKGDDVTQCNACNDCNDTHTHTHTHKIEEGAPPCNADVTGEKTPVPILGTNTSENLLLQTYQKLHGTTGNPRTVLAKIQSALSYGVVAGDIEAEMFRVHREGIKAEIWHITDPLVKAHKQEEKDKPKWPI